MTAVKICGLTRLQDAQAALELGADFLGFIFAESPRRIGVEQAAALVAALPERAVPVGVFVDAPEEEILATVRRVGLKAVQLHGAEDPGLCRRLPLPVIKVIRLRNLSSLEEIRRYRAQYFLLEPQVAGKAGGTGVRADTALAARAVRSFPEHRFLLAGGLGPENVREALRAVRPFGVDASSGLEEVPGIKSREKLKRFFEGVRADE